MQSKKSKAAVTPVRQRTQFSCMSCSMLMCLQACGHDLTEDEINKILGARPMKGAAWEQALACAQYFGCRATLTMPSTVAQLKEWTDAGKAVMIAWNPEGRDWSHASTVYHVTDGLPKLANPDHQIIGSGPGMYVWVADPNMPNPEKTTRIVHEDAFYSKWYEKFPDYLVRRPACCIEREITPDGRQVMASTKAAGRSPNQSGSAAMLKRQGLTPVDVMFGEALPHRRPLVMSGDSIEDQSGKLWLFVGTDERGKAILARDERDFALKTLKLVQDRRHHTTVMSSESRVALVYWNAEAADCYKDWKAGGLSWEEYQECLKQFEDRERGYRRPSRPSGPANKGQLEALDALIAKRPGDRFIKSLRDQVARGRKLSDKQLKAVRQNLYRNQMKDKADLFRGASVSAVARRFLEGNPHA